MATITDDTTLHYELTDETTALADGTILYRIRATRDLPHHIVKAGDLGGFIQSTDNLSGEAWVSDNAKVFNTARVSGKAWVYGSAQVSGKAWIYGSAWVFGNALVSGRAEVSGNAQIYEFARVSGLADISENVQVYGNSSVSGSAWVYGNARVFGDANVKNHASIRSGAFIKNSLDILQGTLYTSTEHNWTLHRTTNGHAFHIGCESGTLDHHQELCNSPVWIDTVDPTDIANARPEYQAVIDLCRARSARW